MTNRDVERMTESELLAIMTGGMATVSGGIMASYVAFLGERIPDIAGHLIAASVMSAPAALVIAKILVPETGVPATLGKTNLDVPKTSSNAIEAAANGALDGLKLALNVAAMLLVFIALITMFNFFIGKIGSWIAMPYLSMEWILGKVMSPVAFIMGVRWEDTAVIGTLLGKKTIINEFVAFYDLSKIVNSADYLKGLVSPKSVVIATYALCGFSNFSSIAIQIGGIGGIAPSRQKDLARLGLRALLAGSFACFMTACIAGVLMPGDGKAKPLGVAQKIESASIKTLDKSFHALKVELTSNALASLKGTVWADAQGKQVEWTAMVFHSTGNMATLYFGFKPFNQLNGNEPDDFIEVSFEGPVSLEPGKTIKFSGILQETQLNPSVLFKLKKGKILGQ